MQLPGRRVEWYRTLDSTMHAASRLAAEGAPSGTVVGADEQTAGRGRHGHAWHSETESGLYVSVILRYPFATESLPLVTLALGLATVDAILKATHLAADLRWPNDVLIRDRKCAGILTQLEGAAVIAGIGINVNHASFPPEIAALATSLRLESGKTQSRQTLLTELVPAIETHCDLLATRGREPILDAFAQASSYVRGRRVQVDQLTGTTAGLNANGFLLLRDDYGKTHTIVAGGVRPCQ